MRDSEDVKMRSPIFTLEKLLLPLFIFRISGVVNKDSTQILSND
ncbi:MAG: hypothetical protein ACHBN1_32570 [Heteroscytonema crispum UTEX LB 1556]